MNYIAKQATDGASIIAKLFKLRLVKKAQCKLNAKDLSEVEKEYEDLRNLFSNYLESLGLKSVKLSECDKSFIEAVKLYKALKSN
jgi:3-methyladenine DNA glycosylase Tag